MIVINANSKRILVGGRRRPVGCNGGQLGTHFPASPSHRLFRRLGRWVNGTFAADILATHRVVRRLHQECLEAFGGCLLELAALGTSPAIRTSSRVRSDALRNRSVDGANPG